MSNYLKDLKDLFTKLTAVGEPVREDDMIFHALNGLPSEYSGFKSAVRLRGYPIDFNELSSILETEELNLAKDAKMHASVETTALAAQFG